MSFNINIFSLLSTFSQSSKHFGIPKHALLHNVPEIYFKNWPDDVSMSRNMSAHLLLTIKLAHRETAANISVYNVYSGQNCA